ncbi:MAG: hypothetical protein WHV66_12405 [Anaerolineales bacterium]
MKLTILGAAGVRTPLMIQSILRRQERIGIDELALMDIDGERLELIGAITQPLEQSSQVQFRIKRTTDLVEALKDADFVIATFRVGGIESRMVDERVPLNYGVLGQETTGPGGFAMGMRTIPVLLRYIEQMRQLCPNAWMIDFANPAGMCTEALTRVGGWQRSVGICDGPVEILRLAAAVLKAPMDEVSLGYFGLNHLGWIRSVRYQGREYLGEMIELLRRSGGVGGLNIAADLITALGMIPNEYLYYYYYRRQSVENILRAERSRGEQIAVLNLELFEQLHRLKAKGDFEGMRGAYMRYLDQRGSSYMQAETGRAPVHGDLERLAAEAAEGEGYAGVALDLIEALVGYKPRQMLLNIPNCGAIRGMSEDDVVEIPAFVHRGAIEPLAIGDVPDHCLGLMKQVKAYERLTVEAAVEGSYQKALTALTIHPLVADYELAKRILTDYQREHGAWFPTLC